MVEIDGSARMGDANMDGLVDATDASRVLKHYADTSVGKYSRGLPFGDANWNNIVDASDASAILEEYAKTSIGEVIPEYFDATGVFIKMPVGGNLSTVAEKKKLPLSKIIGLNSFEDPNKVQINDVVYIRKFEPVETTVLPVITTTLTSTSTTITTTTTTTTTTAGIVTTVPNNTTPITVIENGRFYELVEGYTWCLYDAEDEDCNDSPVRYLTSGEVIALWHSPKRSGKYIVLLLKENKQYNTKINTGNEYHFKYTTYSW